jgi:hypothetical protein
MNNYEKTIAVLQDRVRALEERLTPCDGAVAEPVKWQPKGGYLQIDCGGDVVSVNSFSHQKEFGTKRITKEQAERASVEMRKFNRLLALRDELCGDELCGEGIAKYFIFFNTENKQWDFTHYFVSDYVTPCFTKYEHAQRACDMLNSGEVEL